ncbi:hypothetical protein [Allosphingosinicella vermicomposti]|uniref:hypothetical protein n=1 Tax=Allosphingosinicella vermicomposti TaxID=614671 RepID=UPI000D0EDA96|nr:hypothetical protein [Allosphingosinicella vermicomposti]
MLAGLEQRVRALGDARIAAAAERVAGQIRAALPGDVTVDAVEGGILLSGRALQRRFVLDDRFKWLMAEIGR